MSQKVKEQKTVQTKNTKDEQDTAASSPEGSEDKNN